MTKEIIQRLRLREQLPSSIEALAPSEFGKLQTASRRLEVSLEFSGSVCSPPDEEFLELSAAKQTTSDGLDHPRISLMTKLGKDTTCIPNSIKVLEECFGCNHFEFQQCCLRIISSNYSTEALHGVSLSAQLSHHLQRLTLQKRAYMTLDLHSSLGAPLRPQVA